METPYRMYAIHFDKEVNDRSNETMLLVHIARPVNFKTLTEKYIFQHVELTIEKTGAKIGTAKISGLQKIPDENIPKYELTMEGILKEIK